VDLQFYGANCVVLSNKDVRLVFDDSLAQLGAKSVTKPGDVVLYTTKDYDEPAVEVRMNIAMPGEYEIGNVSVVGIAARAHTDDANTVNATMYKVLVGDVSYLITGHIYPELTDEELENIGSVDVMLVPVGGNGYTVDPVGALKLIKDIEPKLVIPTHYADKSLKYEVPQQPLADALKEIGMEPKETVAKLKLKPTDLSDVTQLVILEKS
jgi:L-ascorbate metabolism protein UlaG (beta-lactamase superfamily)